MRIPSTTRRDSIGSAPSSPLEFRFRPRGAGRWFTVAFLSVWLGGWAAGEGFVLAVLGRGLYALIVGGPSFGAETPPEPGMALAVGGFLLVWLSIWTIGGGVAIREVLRAVWAEDRLRLDALGLTCRRRLGPFVSARLMRRGEISRLYQQFHDGRARALLAQVGAESVELTCLGTEAERLAAHGQLCAALGLTSDEATGAAALPEKWREVIGPQGEHLLVPNPRTRRQQAVIMAVMALFAATTTALLIRAALDQPNLWAVTAMLGAVAAWLVWQTLWLWRGRQEWRIGQGKLVLQRRFGTKAAELVVARSLELVESTDSDGDRWYELSATGLTPPAAPPRGRFGKPGGSVQIDHAMHDPTGPRSLGLWLSQRAGIPLHDRIPASPERQIDIAGISAELAEHGRLGRIVANLLKRANSSRDQ